MAKNTDVAKMNDQGTAMQAIPDWMRQETTGQGLEDMGSEDMATPRLKLLQSTSPEVTDGDEKIGALFHSLIEQALNSDKPLRVVPVYVQKKYILWKPQHDGGGILARAEDGVHWAPDHGTFAIHPNKGDKETVEWKLARTVKESRLDQWGSHNPRDPNSSPAATLMYCFVVYFPDFPDVPPAVLTLQRSTAKTALKWIGRMKVARAPIYGQIFTLDVQKETNSDGQDFRSLKIVPSGFVDQNTFAELKKVHEGFVAAGLRMKDEDGLQGEGMAGGNADDALPEGAPAL